MKVFKHKKYKLEYLVDTYKIDLYFLNAKIAIECDEFGHQDRDAQYEIDREDFVKNQLGCKFVRFNPDKEGFCIFDTIHEIAKLM